MNDTPNPTHQVLAQADALMRRHRVFVAGAAAPVAAPAPLAEAEEDIPVLTEVVAENLAENFEPMPVADPVASALAAKQQQIESALDRWLDKELPNEILRVMDGISDQLIGTLVRRMRDELLPQLLESPLPEEASASDSGAPNSGVSNKPNGLL
jgi:hypothetical protein